MLTTDKHATCYALHLIAQTDVFLILLAAYTFDAGAQLDYYSNVTMSICLIGSCSFLFLVFVRNM